MSIPVIVGVTAFITILLASTTFAAEKVAPLWSPAIILGIAAILRLLFLYRPPELSDDIYRYLWDGLRTLNGYNPYSAAPSQVQTLKVTFLQLLKHINHPDLITIYPPAAQITFAVGTLFGHTILGIKALLIIIDLATCCVLLKILSHLKLPSWRCALYAWHPLPVLEIAASGHIDGTGVFFFLLALLLLLKQGENSLAGPAGKDLKPIPKKIMPSLLSGFSFAFAALVKFIPLIFLPGLLMIIKKRSRMFFLIGVISGAVILIFPFLPEVKNSFVTLHTYLQNWEFSGFAFRILRNSLFSGRITRILLAFAFFLIAIFFYAKFCFPKESITWHETRKNLRLFNIGQLQSSMDSYTFLNLLKTFYLITMSFLLLTTTLYPWYVLYLACLLPFAAGPAGTVLSWAVFLSYRVLIPYTLLGSWIEDDFTSAMIWTGPVLAFILAALSKKLSKYRSSCTSATY